LDDGLIVALRRVESECQPLRHNRATLHAEALLGHRRDQRGRLFLLGLLAAEHWFYATCAGGSASASWRLHGPFSTSPCRSCSTWDAGAGGRAAAYLVASVAGGIAGAAAGYALGAARRRARRRLTRRRDRRHRRAAYEAPTDAQAPPSAGRRVRPRGRVALRPEPRPSRKVAVLALMDTASTSSDARDRGEARRRHIIASRRLSPMTRSLASGVQRLLGTR
jgi:hypothetical protein